MVVRSLLLVVLVVGDGAITVEGLIFKIIIIIFFFEREEVEKRNLLIFFFFFFFFLSFFLWLHSLE